MNNLLSYFSIYAQVNKKFPTMPFTLRYVEGEETSSKMGVRECVTHGLLTPYGVLAERAGDHIAHVKYTVLLMPNGTVKITGLEKPEGFSSRELPEELAALLAVDEAALAAEKKKLKKKAARSKKAGGGASAGATEEEA